MVADALSKQSPPLPRGIWILGFVSLLMDVSSELIHSLLPVFLVTVIGAGALTVGVVEGLAEATALIVKVFSGVLSDYWRRRKSLAVIGYGLSAFTKPLFALAGGVGLVITARLADRVGKGIRGAPRDALIADMTPAHQRGAAYGLRQSLDTVGAFTGPLLAIALMLLWNDDYRKVFWVAVIPAILAVLLLQFCVRETPLAQAGVRRNPIQRDNLKRLPPAYWWVVGVGAFLTLARFSEAFLLLRAEEGGLPPAWIPMVLVAMNVVYALSAYPFGRLADRVSHAYLLAWGLLPLMIADLILAYSNHSVWVFGGVAFWGLHMGMTQGLLAAMVADQAPEDLRGTAFGMFNLMAGGAMLFASLLAGWLWQTFGATSSFLAGTALASAALILLLWRRGAAV